MPEEVYRSSDQVAVAGDQVTVRGNSYSLEDISWARVELLGMHLAPAGFELSGMFLRIARIAAIAVLLIVPVGCVGLASTGMYIARGDCCSPPDPTAHLMRFLVSGLLAVGLVCSAIVSIFAARIWWMTVTLTIAALASIASFVLGIIGNAPPVPLQVVPSLSDPLMSAIWTCLFFLLVVVLALGKGYGTSITLHGAFGAITAYRSWNPLAVHKVFVVIDKALADRNSSQLAAQNAPEV